MRRFFPLAFATSAVLAALYVAAQTLRQPTPIPTADRLIVTKSTHTLALYRKGQLLKTYRVALGRGGLAPKRQAGDAKTPEGTYLITEHNPHSSFHRALRVGYPSQAQIADAQAHHIDPGGDIMIHGIKNGLGWLGPLQRLHDWTAGCIALTDPEVEEVYASVPDGTPVSIVP